MLERSTSASSTDLRDEWKIPDEYLVRVHNRPRTALFTPSDLKDSPKLPELLTGLRTTRYQWARATEIHESQYDITGPTARLELGTHWAGGTLCNLHPS